MSLDKVIEIGKKTLQKLGYKEDEYRCVACFSPQESSQNLPIDCWAIGFLCRFDEKYFVLWMDIKEEDSSVQRINSTPFLLSQEPIKNQTPNDSDKEKVREGYA